MSETENKLFFKQLLSGRDFATNDKVAVAMKNFTYLIGSYETRTCLVVDPTYNIQDILNKVAFYEFELKGVLVTHYHPDHVGGNLFGFDLQGLKELLNANPCPVYANKEEIKWITEVTGIESSELVAAEGGEELKIGNIAVTFLHTPGHTEGSQCFLVENNLVSGDTLFLEGCGRLDLPGADPEKMYESLNKLAKLPNHTLVYPGHDYSQDTSANLGVLKSRNYVFKPRTREEWIKAFS